MALLFNWLHHSLPKGEACILTDDGQLGMSGTAGDRRIVPFIERDGQYWGHPASAQHEIEELERLRHAGVHWLVIAWPRRSWLNDYGDFERHLHRHYRLALNFPHGVIFDLRTTKGALP